MYLDREHQKGGGGVKRVLTFHHSSGFNKMSWADGSLPPSPPSCSIGAPSKLKYLINSSANCSCGVHFETGILVAAVFGRWKEHALARNDGVFVTGFAGLGTTVGAGDVWGSRYVSATYLNMSSAVLMASSWAPALHGSAVVENQWLRKHGCRTMKGNLCTHINIIQGKTYESQGYKNGAVLRE